MKGEGDMREIDEIIIHCSDSSFGNAALIDSWHRERGFDKVGYHYVILNGWLTEKLCSAHMDGHMETGRHTEEVGAHCYGKNTKSIGVCLIGKSGQFSWQQLNTLANFIARAPHDVKIGFHSDYSSEKPHCPGIDAKDILKAMAHG